YQRHRKSSWLIALQRSTRCETEWTCRLIATSQTRADSPLEKFAAAKPAKVPRRLRRSRPQQRCCNLSFGWQILTLVGFRANLTDKHRHLHPRSTAHVETR